MNLQCLLFAIVCLSSSNADLPITEIPLGRINGYYKTSYQGRQYAVYKGIPYALPPIGERRFQPPVPVTKYPCDINATKVPVLCTQYDPLLPQISSVQGEEDCLYLNLYTPLTKNPQLLPVIFWIHGGGFQYGTSSNYGAKYLMDKDVILITFNYRVGPFGFLSTGDDIVPGNMGLKDQSLALKWVSDNVRYFNGDRDRITLMGVSAGGASVHYHYLSPMSAGLFRNGVSFSGTALTHWAYINDSFETTKDLAKALNCPINSSKTIVQCLRKINAKDIGKAVHGMISQLYFSYVLFPPVAEKINKNYFINDLPINILKEGKSNDVPWITGVVSEEGLFMTAAFALNENMMAYTDRNWETLAPYMLMYLNDKPKHTHVQLAKLSRKYYLGDKPLSTDRKIVKNFTRLIGDDLIIAGAVRAARLQASLHKSPVQFYYYTYRAAQSLSDKLSNTTENLGVSHDDDIYVVLENQYLNPTTTASDRAMLKYMLNFWESIVRDGKPDLGTEWPKLNPSEKFEYMHIAGPGNFTMQTNDNLGEISFWDSIGL